MFRLKLLRMVDFSLNEEISIYMYMYVADDVGFTREFVLLYVGIFSFNMKHYVKLIIFSFFFLFLFCVCKYHIYKNDNF